MQEKEHKCYCNISLKIPICGQSTVGCRFPTADIERGASAISGAHFYFLKSVMQFLIPVNASFLMPSVSAGILNIRLLCQFTFVLLSGKKRLAFNHQLSCHLTLSHNHFQFPTVPALGKECFMELSLGVQDQFDCGVSQSTIIIWRGAGNEEQEEHKQEEVKCKQKMKSHFIRSTIPQSCCHL